MKQATSTNDSVTAEATNPMACTSLMVSINQIINENVEIQHMSYFAPYIDASGIHMPTYEDRMLGAYGDGSAAVTYETGI